MPTVPVMRVNESATTTGLAEAIINLGHRASREFPVVGNDAAPTPWDLRHRAINETLDLWEMARA